MKERETVESGAKMNTRTRAENIDKLWDTGMRLNQSTQAKVRQGERGKRNNCGDNLMMRHNGRDGRGANETGGNENQFSHMLRREQKNGIGGGRCSQGEIKQGRGGWGGGGNGGSGNHSGGIL